VTLLSLVSAAESIKYIELLLNKAMVLT